MIVMQLHKWFDEDVEEVLFDGRPTVREIVLKNSETSLLISRQDVIALAKEFELIVYEKYSNL